MIIRTNSTRRDPLINKLDVGGAVCGARTASIRFRDRLHLSSVATPPAGAVPADS